MNIPQLDLANFLKGDVLTRKQFIDDLGSAFENVGFVSIINHGISQTLIDSVYKDVELFFFASSFFQEIL